MQAVVATLRQEGAPAFLEVLELHVAVGEMELNAQRLAVTLREIAGESAQLAALPGLVSPARLRAPGRLRSHRERYCGSAGRSAQGSAGSTAGTSPECQPTPTSRSTSEPMPIIPDAEDNLSTDFAALLSKLEHVLSDSQIWELQIHVEYDEHELAFEMLCDVLRRAVVTVPEAADEIFHHLAIHFGTDEALWRALLHRKAT